MGGVSAFSSLGSFSTFNFQSNSNCLTDSREITVSSRAQPLRCESPPKVSQLPAINRGLHAIPSKRVFRNRLFIGIRWLTAWIVVVQQCLRKSKRVHYPVCPRNDVLTSVEHESDR